jgi:hypothetical protein
MDKNIDQIFGCYKLINVLENKSADGHLLYVGECVFCKEKIEQRLICFKKLTNKKCVHLCFGVKTSLLNNKKLRSIFQGMLRRCYDDKNKDYKYYGLKNVSICKEWTDNPIKFEQWALKNGYENNLTIDRKDSNKNYCPENCRWITPQDNSRYKSSTILIEVDGVIRTGRDWASFLNIGTNLINKYRREKGMDFVVNFIHNKLNSINK